MRTRPADQMTLPNAEFVRLRCSMQNPPFPNRPTCGHRFGGSGVWRPKDDSRDVVVFFHSTERPCDVVYGSVATENGALIRLGSLDDYQGNMVPIVERSDFLFDLADDADGGAAQ